MSILNPGVRAVSLRDRTPVNTTHHDGATAAAVGAAVVLGGKYATLTVQIRGTTATGLDIRFKGTVNGVNYASVVGVRLSDSTTATSTTGDDEIWQFDVTGLDRFIVDLFAITGGSVTVVSKAVA